MLRKGSKYKNTSKIKYKSGISSVKGLETN